MHLFWDPIIEPLLRALDARRLLEIGSDRGETTRRLLDYCQSVDGFLEVIDPLPKYDPATWFDPWPGRVAFHPELSLNVLSRLAPVDVALIDGDHNWYTVYQELKLLDKTARQAGASLPLVLLHDVGWPYGRRDLYYDPETIPVGYRKPYRQQGLRHGQAALAETGGLNPHLCNSIYEHNLQNGVLTAVEDFVAEAPPAAELRLELLPGLHGLAILYPAVLEEREPFRRLLLELIPTPRQRRYLEVLEGQRLELQVRDAEQSFDLRAARRRAEQQDAALQTAAQERAGLAQQLSAAQDAQTRQQAAAATARSALEQQLAAERAERAGLAERLAQIESERVALADRLVHSEQTRQALLQERAAAVSEGESLRQQLTQAATERDALAAQTTALDAELAAARRTPPVRAADPRAAARLAELEAAVQRYREGLERIERDYHAIRASARWRLGHALVRILELLLLRGRPALVIDHLGQLLESSRRWGPRPAPAARAPAD